MHNEMQQHTEARSTVHRQAAATTHTYIGPLAVTRLRYRCVRWMPVPAPPPRVHVVAASVRLCASLTQRHAVLLYGPDVCTPHT